MATRSIRAGLLTAVFAAAVLVPAASGQAPIKVTLVKLTRVPLPKSALGPAGSSLPLARDSGVVSNAKAASQSSAGVTARKLTRLGRVSGYLLDYGNPFGSGAGIREIQTAVEWYRSTADARKGLEFWRRDELNNIQLRKLGLVLSFTRLRPSGIPGPHWVYASSGSIKGLEPIQGVDVELQYGRYLLDVSVAAGSTSAAARLVPTLAHKLYQRMRQAVAGRVPTGSAKLPPPLRPGPPPHGPEPASLMLTPVDLGGSATVVHKGYSKPESSLDENALSVYDRTMTSTGTFRLVSQEVLVGGSQLEVQYFGAIAVGAVGAAFGSGAKVTTLDLSDAGDDARGELLQLTGNGRSAYEAVLALTHGTYLDFVGAVSPAPLTAADVSGLARRAAKRLDAGF
jgi:hypothetical protein